MTNILHISGKQNFVTVLRSCVNLFRHTFHLFCSGQKVRGDIQFCDLDIVRGGSKKSKS